MKSHKSSSKQILTKHKFTNTQDSVHVTIIVSVNVSLCYGGQTSRSLNYKAADKLNDRVGK